MPTLEREYRRIFLVEIVRLRHLRAILRATADDEAFGYGTRHVAQVRAQEIQSTLTMLRRMWADMVAVERSRAEDYLTAAAAEAVA